jgi:hypothetical protein
MICVEMMEEIVKGINYSIHLKNKKRILSSKKRDIIRPMARNLVMLINILNRRLFGRSASELSQI